jgi:uroporphyrinogen decarboxylase
MTGYAGIKMNEYATNPKVMVEAQKIANDRFGGLIGYWPDFGIAVEVSGLGAKIKFPDDSPPWVEEPVLKETQDVDKLQVPDVKRDGLFPQYWKTWDYMESKGIDLSTPLSLLNFTVGPLDQAALLCGVTKFMDILVHSPALAHKILKVTSETCIAFLKTVEERAGGLPGKAIFVADDYGGFMSPRMFREFEIKYSGQIYNSFSSDYLRIWGSDSDRTVAIASLLPEMRVNVLYALSGDIDIAKMKEETAGKICVMGNIHPLKVLLRGSRAEVEEASRQCIQKAAKGGGFVLAPGGEVVRGTPPENIEAMIGSASKYGSYPIQE